MSILKHVVENEGENGFEVIKQILEIKGYYVNCQLNDVYPIKPGPTIEIIFYGRINHPISSSINGS